MIISLLALLFSIYGMLDGIGVLSSNVKIVASSFIGVATIVPGLLSIVFFVHDLKETKHGKLKFIAHLYLRAVFNNYGYKKVLSFMSFLRYCDPFSWIISDGYNNLLIFSSIGKEDGEIYSNIPEKISVSENEISMRHAFVYLFIKKMKSVIFCKRRIKEVKFQLSEPDEITNEINDSSVKTISGNYYKESREKSFFIRDSMVQVNFIDETLCQDDIIYEEIGFNRNVKRIKSIKSQINFSISNVVTDEKRSYLFDGRKLKESFNVPVPLEEFRDASLFKMVNKRCNLLSSYKNICNVLDKCQENNFYFVYESTSENRESLSFEILLLKLIKKEVYTESINVRSIIGGEVVKSVCKMLKFKNADCEKLSQHSYKFWGKHDAIYITHAVTKYSRPEQAKNSEWKLYKSDIKRAFPKRSRCGGVYKESQHFHILKDGVISDKDKQSDNYIFDEEEKAIFKEKSENQMREEVKETIIEEVEVEFEEEVIVKVPLNEEEKREKMRKNDDKKRSAEIINGVKSVINGTDKNRDFIYRNILGSLPSLHCNDHNYYNEEDINFLKSYNLWSDDSFRNTESKSKFVYGFYDDVLRDYYKNKKFLSEMVKKVKESKDINDYENFFFELEKWKVENNVKGFTWTKRVNTNSLTNLTKEDYEEFSKEADDLTIIIMVSRIINNIRENERQEEKIRNKGREREERGGEGKSTSLIYVKNEIRKVKKKKIEKVSKTVTKKKDKVEENQLVVIRNNERVQYTNKEREKKKRKERKTTRPKNSMFFDEVAKGDGELPFKKNLQEKQSYFFKKITKSNREGSNDESFLSLFLKAYIYLWTIIELFMTESKKRIKFKLILDFSKDSLKNKLNFEFKKKMLGKIIKSVLMYKYGLKLEIGEVNQKSKRKTLGFFDYSGVNF